jgi:hypothetical protein
MATHRQPTADEQPGGKRCETNITKASLHPFLTIIVFSDAQKIQVL